MVGFNKYYCLEFVLLKENELSSPKCNLALEGFRENSGSYECDISRYIYTHVINTTDLGDVNIKAWNATTKEASGGLLGRQDGEAGNHTEILTALKQELEVVLISCCVTNYRQTIQYGLKFTDSGS